MILVRLMVKAIVVLALVKVFYILLPRPLKYILKTTYKVARRINKGLIKYFVKTFEYCYKEFLLSIKDDYDNNEKETLEENGTSEESQNNVIQFKKG